MPGSRFIWIFGGTAASQLLLFLTNPIIAYLYGTSIYGQLAWALTLSSILQPLMTGRMEVYLMGVRNPASAYPSILGSLILTSLCALIVLVVDPIIRINRIQAPTYAIIVLASIYATYATASSIFCINDETKRQAVLKISRVLLIFAIAVIGHLFWRESINGLLLSYAVGSAIITIIIIRLTQHVITSSKYSPNHNWNNEVRPFLIFNTPHAFLCALTSGLPLAYIFERFGANIAGQYSFAWQYLVGPTQLIAGSLYQTMYQSELAVKSRSAHIARYAPPIVFSAIIVVAVAQYFVSPIMLNFPHLGDWKDVLPFYIYLIPISITMLSTGSLAFLPLIHKKQKTNFMFEIIYLSGYFSFLVFAPPTMTSHMFIKVSAWVALALRIPQLVWYFKLLKEPK